jgi:hypothetical protein
MSLIVLEPNIIALQGTTERISITITDSAGTPTQPVELKLSIFDLGGTEKVSDIWPAPAIRLVNVSPGKFYVDIGNQLINTETDAPYRWVFDWRIQMVAGGGYTHSIQNVNIISVRTAHFLPDLRLLIDKSRKLTSANEGCYLGYSDSMLVSFLEGGLQTINAYQPSLTMTLENYPLEYKQILIDSALITGVMSQQLYAIDTDINNYSDQGTAFVITHQAQLAGFLNQVTARLDRLIPQMKLQLISPGAVHTQMGPSFRLQTLISASPQGSLFRGIYFWS